MSEYRPLLGPPANHNPTTSSHDVPITLGSLHELVQSTLNPSDRFTNSSDGLSSGQSSNDVTPNTPQRSPLQPTPLTPLANLKVLMAAAAAASSAIEEDEGGMASGKPEVVGGACGGEEEGGVAGRKMKSLALLCKKFLSIVEDNVGSGNEFSLDMMARNLGTNRRRIYDIINVLEAVEMIVKQSKNWYSWIGRGRLLHTLAKLKAMAGDDPELLQWFKQGDHGNSKENIAPPTIRIARQQGQSSLVIDEASQDSNTDDSIQCDDAQTKGGRWDKSLGILCQKFIMLFLVAPGHELTLDLAGTILMPDDDSTSLNNSSNSKTKVRRLYDIANVLTTLDLIKKKTFMAPNHRKMPGYTWCGPTLEEIDAISVCRKSEIAAAPVVYSRKMKGTTLVRKASFSGRPSLHQYEVKDSNSAPSTPCKSVPTTKPLGGRPLGNFTGGHGGLSIRRSLSFGGQSSSAKTCGGGGGGCGRGRKVGGAKSEDMTTVSASPQLSSVDYMNEMKEFENEMRKHSHRFPNVVSMFQDFIRQYQVSLEQTGASNHTIFPKLPTTSSLTPNINNFSSPLGYSTPHNPTDPVKISPDPQLNFSSCLKMDPNMEISGCKKSHLVSHDDSGFTSGNSMMAGAIVTSSDDVIGISGHDSMATEKAFKSTTIPISSNLSTMSPLAVSISASTLELSHSTVLKSFQTASNTQRTSHLLARPTTTTPRTIFNFTKGTLQSPEKPAFANSQAFVRVEDFLSALQAQSMKADSLLRDPCLVAKAINRHPPCGVQPLTTLSLLSRLLTPKSPVSDAVVSSGVPQMTSDPSRRIPLNPSSLVNQKPIPATGQVKSKMSAAKSVASGIGENLGFINQNSLNTSPPTQFLAPQTLLPTNTAPLFRPLAQNYLPSFSTLCSRTPPTTYSRPPSEHHSASVSECSPPKRIKLD